MKPKNTSLKDSLSSKYGRRWVIFDIAWGTLSLFAAFNLTPYVDVYLLSNRILVSCAYGCIFAGCLRLSGLNTHRFEHIFSYYEIVVSTIIGTIFAFLLIALAVTFTHVHVFGRYVILYTVVFSLIGVCAQRSLVKFYAARKPLKLFILGCTPSAYRLIERISGHKEFEASGIACVEFSENGNLNEVGKFSISSSDQLREHIISQNVDTVVSCYGEYVPDVIEETMQNLPFHGIDVINKGYFMETYFREISVDFKNYHWLTSHSFRPIGESHLFLKRVFDAFFGTALGLVILPILPVVALFIKLDSSGPAFYSQIRVGRLGKSFRIYKFRSMRTDAETSGAVWAQKKDTRVTRIGAFLRKTRIDELPQIWNIIKGDMSFIGPRPERPEFVEQLSKEIPLYEWRHLIAPGLTGWAQIRYKYGDTVEDAKRKLQYDLYYIKKASLSLEIQILLQTIPLIMKGSQ